MLARLCSWSQVLRMLALVTLPSACAESQPVFPPAPRFLPPPIVRAAADPAGEFRDRRQERLEEQAAALSVSDRALFQRALAVLRSPCDEPHSLRDSFLKDRACLLAPRAVSAVYAQIQEGYQLPDIKDAFQARFQCPREIIPTEGSVVTIASKQPLLTVIEFFDFQCKECRRAQQYIERLRTEIQYSGIRLVMMSSPVLLHRHSTETAAAALALWQQHPEHHLRFSRRLFAHPRPLDEQQLRTLLTEEPLDQARFARDLITALAQVRREQDIGARLSPPVSATPTFFVNGCRITDASRLLARVEDELLRQRRP